MRGLAIDPSRAIRAPAALAPVLEALRGLRLRHLGAAVAVGFLGAALRGYFIAFGYANGQSFLPKLPATVLQGIVLVLAVLIADAYVRQGARPRIAYGAAVVGSAVLGSVANYHLTLALGGQNFFGPEVALPVRRTEILFSSILQIVESGFGVAAYLRWRESEAMSRRLQASELRRAQQEREMQRRLLRALQARVEPELLFGALRSIGEIIEGSQPRAHRMLGDVIALLRLLMPNDGAPSHRRGSTVEHELAIVAAYVRVRNGCDDTALQLELSVAADAESASMPPMILMPLVRAILRRPALSKAPLRIDAGVEDGELVMVVTAGQAGAEPMIDGADLAMLRQRLREAFGALPLRADVVHGPDSLTLRMPVDHDPEPVDGADR